MSDSYHPISDHYPVNPRSFFEEGRFQKFCAVCESAGPFEVHHVVSKHRLKKMGLYTILYDGRNALRLCEGLSTNRCHGEHTNGKLTIETAKLTNENICFVWETLDVAGQNYLERHYTGPDARYLLHEEDGGQCPLCQLLR